MGADLRKGTRIHARWVYMHPFEGDPYAGKEGAVAVTQVDLTGICRHFRGDDLVNPTVVRVYIEPDGDVPESIPRTRPYGCTCPGHERLIEVRPEWVVGVVDG